jgi:HAD superfamily hydrolase (TIGR01509 family)
MREADFKPLGVLFDMDGLMLDTERPCIAAWLEAAMLNGRVIDESVPRAVVGMDEKSSRKLFMEKLGPDFPYEKVHIDLVRLMRDYEARHGVGLRPGLLPLLKHLASLGLPLAVATSTARARALQKLEKAGILPYFSAAACGDEVSRGKPEPDIFLLAASRIGISADACLGFEDSPAGLRSLAAAGIRPVFVKDIVEPPPEVLARVWRRFESLDEAIPLFS